MTSGALLGANTLGSCRQIDFKQLQRSSRPLSGPRPTKRHQKVSAAVRTGKTDESRSQGMSMHSRNVAALSRQRPMNVLVAIDSQKHFHTCLASKLCLKNPSGQLTTGVLSSGQLAASSLQIAANLDLTASASSPSAMVCRGALSSRQQHSLSGNPCSTQ